ncbi:MAG: 4-alpha-glucanotransferase [Thermoplasmata archaeon]|nr:MAG: 4-alpha-glucanotransferase [Thermoplasmata archaeon]
MTVYFIFGLHNHQPVGNFSYVFEHAYNSAYNPVLETLEDYPEMKVSLHYTGPLLEWIEENHPEHLDLLKKLISRGQVEIVISGFYEPVLAAIPEADRLLQLRLAKDYAKKIGYNPKGVWITERFWEPSLAKDIAKAGLDFAIVDDQHFLAAGLKKENLYGYYLTEHEGHAIAVFPIDEYLRYLTPFRPVERTITYLKHLDERFNNPLVVIHDDGEKYGVWPGTYEWVHKKGWLREFFEEITSNEMITTTTYSEYMKSHPPLGLVYLPTTSYFEMSEWSLPADQAKELVDFVNWLKSENKFKKYRVFVKGGIWKNFFYKYPEANYMHKRMLFLSELTKRSLKAKMYVLRAQCNDAYWHGIFGGVYLPHLREAIWRNLIAAHDHVARGRIYVRDIDIDGHVEILYERPKYFAVLKPSYGGALIELSSRKKLYNYVDVLSRHREHYHEISTTAAPQDEGGGLESIHEIKKKIPEEIRKELFYDNRRRYLFQEHLIGSDTTLEDVYSGRVMGIGETYARKYDVENIDAKQVTLSLSSDVAYIKKTYVFTKQDVLIVDYYIKPKISGMLLIELNVGVHAKKEFVYEEDHIDKVVIDDQVFGRLLVELSEESILWRYPIKTLSQSESGWDFIQQGASYNIIKDVEKDSEVRLRILLKDI